MSIRRKKSFQFFELEEFGLDNLKESGLSTTPLYSALPVIQAHGVGGADVEGEGNIFLSANNSRVETHKGTDITLNCRVARDSDYGTVSTKSQNLSGLLRMMTILCTAIAIGVYSQHYCDAEFHISIIGFLLLSPVQATASFI